MMQNLRRQTRLILFIVVAAFVLLIFFQWGLDITGISRTSETDIAKIDETTIAYVDYLRYVQSKEHERKNITRDEIWEMMINEVMWNSLIQKEKIRTTDDEIWQIIKNNPPKQIYESEYMKNEQGQFDYGKYLELLKSPQSRQWLLEYEFNLRKELPREKLRSLLSTLGWSSPYEDSTTIVKQTTLYDISFISLFPFRLRNLLPITDEELSRYYNENKKDFITPQVMILKYVFFERNPSSQDTIEAKENLEDFITRIKEGEDFLTLAKEVSDDTLIEVSFENENQLFPNERNIYKSLKDGEISQIFPCTQGFEVIKRVRKGLFYAVKTYIDVSPTTIGEIHDRIESFKGLIKDLGFDSAAAEFNLAVRRTQPLIPERINFPVRNTEPLKKFLLKKPQKDKILGPLSSIGGYYIFTLDSIISEKIWDLKENHDGIKARYERVKLKELVKDYLDSLYNQIISGHTMEQLSATDTFVMFTNDIKGMKLADIESRYGPEFAGVVAQLEPNQVARPLLTDWAGYIIRCDKKTTLPFDSTLVQYLQRNRQQRLQRLSQSIFTPKKVTDNRDKFFE